MPVASALRLLAPQAGRLVGRQRECRALEQMLASLTTGQSAVVVVRGDAGIGKTRLLDFVCDQASGCRVVSASAVPVETGLSFSGLHQVCAPLLDRVACLPRPQRDALERAFGMTEGVPPDRFLIGVAVLNLLRQIAEEQPVVCLVDDAQWLDVASSQVLGFVARRLGPQGIAFVFAAPTAVMWLEDLPQMHLDALPYEDAHALLRSVLHGPVDERVSERMIAETDANPRALLSLAAGSTPTRLAGGFGDPRAWIACGAGDQRLEALLGELSQEARMFLVVAAAEPLGEPLLLWRAAERLGIAAGPADAAQHTALLEIGSRVRFCDPQVRAAVYHSARPADRHAAHRALAEVTDTGEPERRAWHLAYAAPGPDEDVAGQLERWAPQAAVRGGMAALSAFLAKAAELTPEPLSRARRALAAAEIEQRVAPVDHALRTLVTAERQPLAELDRARCALLRARAHQAPALLLDAAVALEDLDLDLAREAYLDALTAAILDGAADGVSPVDIAQRGLAAPRPEKPRAADELFDGLALQLSAGPAVAADALRTALSPYAGGVPDTRAGRLAAHVACVLGEAGYERRIVENQVRAAREGGVLDVLPDLMTQRVSIHLRDGELVAATALTHELHALTEATGRRPWIDGALLVAAYCGREDEARELIDEAHADLSPGDTGLRAALVSGAHLILCNGLALYEEGVSCGRHLLQGSDLVAQPPWGLPELVEAASRAGAVGEATTALNQLAERAAASGTESAVALEARSRALLSDGLAAEALYLKAITGLARSGSRLELARARLVYGEWLRREGRRVDARKHLRDAYEMLTGMGAEGFATRARRELRATGETARKRTVQSGDDLTPQEQQIAQMARDGLSNPEIGARLFISPRTVEWHLRKIYSKLAISSRVSLREALSDQAPLPA